MNIYTYINNYLIDEAIKFTNDAAEWRKRREYGVCQDFEVLFIESERTQYSIFDCTPLVLNYSFILQYGLAKTIKRQINRESIYETENKPILDL